jgi:hypothetical protein
MKKIYYKHITITTGDQDDVEKEINSYINEGDDINIISLNVTPERVGTIDYDGYTLPKYWYHISMTYTSNEE